MAGRTFFWQPIARRLGRGDRKRARRSAGRRRFGTSLRRFRSLLAEPLEDRRLLSIDLTGIGVPVTAPQPNVPFTAQVATFSHPLGPGGTAEPVSNFRAMIDWGDGTTASSGDIHILGPQAGTYEYEVVGTHTYAGAGTPYAMTVLINEPSAVASNDVIQLSLDASMTSPASGTWQARARYTNTTSSRSPATKTVAGLAAFIIDVEGAGELAITWSQNESPQNAAGTKGFIFGRYDCDSDPVTGLPIFGQGISGAQLTFVPSLVYQRVGLAAGSDPPMSWEYPVVLASGTFSLGPGHVGTLTVSAQGGAEGFNSLIGSGGVWDGGAPEAPSAVLAEESLLLGTTATVSEPAVVATAAPFGATEGVAFTGQAVATFTDPGGPGNIGDYSATIDWGDGTTPTTGDISLSGSVFTVAGDHTYAADDAYTVTIAISHEPADVATVQGLATVLNAPVARTWDGHAGGNWTTAANWIGGPLDPLDSPAFPGGTAQTTSFNDFSPGTIFGSITLSGGGYVISGNGIAITAGITNSIPAVESNQLLLDVHFAAATTNVVTDGGTLNISGAVSASGVVAKSGTGTLIISGPQSWDVGAVLQIGSAGGGSPAGGGQLAAPNALVQADTLPPPPATTGNDAFGESTLSWAPAASVPAETIPAAQPAAAAEPVAALASPPATFTDVLVTGDNQTSADVTAVTAETVSPKAVDAVLAGAAGQPSSGAGPWFVELARFYEFQQLDAHRQQPKKDSTVATAVEAVLASYGL